MYMYLCPDLLNRPHALLNRAHTLVKRKPSLVNRETSLVNRDTDTVRCIFMALNMHGVLTQTAPHSLSIKIPCVKTAC